MYDGEGSKPKPSPKSFSINLNQYAAATEWLRGFLIRNHGLAAAKVLHDAYPNVWRVYDIDGDIIISIDHDLMTRIALVLEQIEWLIADNQPEPVLSDEDQEYYDQLREIMTNDEEDGA